MNLQATNVFSSTFLYESHQGCVSWRINLNSSGLQKICTPCTANPDTFNFNSTKHCGSVLSNDNGTGIKVVNVSKTTNGGKVSMSKNGNFCYKPAHCSKTTINDSFTYTIENKCGQKSTATVTINYKCR
jgi:Bacterial Ig domain